MVFLFKQYFGSTVTYSSNSGFPTTKCLTFSFDQLRYCGIVGNPLKAELLIFFTTSLLSKYYFLSLKLNNIFKT